MMDILIKLIKKHHDNISIYTKEIFERRCQEEIVRSDEEHSSFVYIEFEFNAIQEHFKIDAHIQKFWEVFLAVLSKGMRRSDIIGFLENNAGIGMLVLDSKIEGWNRIEGRLKQAATEQDFDIMAPILSKIVKPIVYPACLF